MNSEPAIDLTPSTFDELVARISTQPVEILARAIARQAAAIGGSTDWSNETMGLLTSSTVEAVEGLGLPSLTELAREPVLFWRSMAR